MPRPEVLSAASPAPRPARLRRRSQRGQSLVIFALVSTVVFGIMGLAIDGGISYMTASDVERAAAAGALAGVTYMPDQYSPKAITAAKQAAARNGFVDGSNGVVVSVYRVPQGCDAGGGSAGCYSNRLGVSVSTLVNNTFTRVLGFGPNHAVAQRATAEYLPTLTLGQPDPHLGSTQPQINASPPQGYYFIRHEGWGTPRTEGDAYTPNPGPQSSNDLHTLNSANEVDMTQFASQGFGALPDRGGYSYQVVVPQGTTNARINVYNPSHAPNAPNDYRENDGTFNSGQAAQYDVMEYTLFKVVNQYQHNQDIPLSQVIVNPINSTSSSQASWSDPRTGNTVTASAISAFYQNWIDPTKAAYTDGEANGGHLVTINHANDVDLGPGIYRLRVDTLDGSGKWPQATGANASSVAANAGGGHKGYALRVMSGGAECNACSLGALNEFAFYTPIQDPGGGSSFEIPIVNIPKQYAGQTINVYAFDPGDVSGSNYLDIVNGQTDAVATSANGVSVYGLGVNRTTTPNPALQMGTGGGYPQPDPTAARVLSACTGSCNTGTGGCTSGNGGTATHPFNGCWVLFKIPVPGDYNPPDLQHQYWKLRYELSGGKATDTVTIAVGFDGPPVHLVPNG